MSGWPSPRVGRTAVIATGALLAGIGLMRLRADHAALYATFVVVITIATIDPAEVFPGVRLRLSNLAISIGFVYVGGLPIIALGLATEMALLGLRVLAPEALVRRVPQLRSLHASGGLAILGPGWAAQEATGAIGVALRWWIATALAARLDPGAPVWTSMTSIAVAELVGYQVWALLASFPIFPDRPLLPRGRVARARRGVNTAIADMALVVLVLITPFVFLMLYGYAAAGLLGLAGWSLAAVLAHRLFKRLADRRIQVESQNERLEALNRELGHRERLSAIGKMSSVVSHQILQQLGVIGIFADLVRHAPPDGDAEKALARTREHGAAIEGALEDVNRVLRDLLVFGRELRVNVYPNRVAALLGEVEESCRPEAESAGVRIEVSCAPDLVATFDKLKLRQALENLVRNAVAASPRGGVVRVEARARSGTLEIAVEDQGEGVAEENRDAIFAPFFTTKEHGTGLGLAIAREFIVAHGGSLSLEQASTGRLARFVLTIPVAVGVAPAPQFAQ